MRPDRASVGRHPRDAVVGVVALAVAAGCTVAAARGAVNPVETAIAEELRRLPGSVAFWDSVTWAGSLWAVGLAALVLVSVERFRTALAVSASGVLAYVVASTVAGVVEPRAMPHELGTTAVSFPAGYVTVAAAVAAAAAPYFAQVSKGFVWAAVVLVATADVVRGAALPLDAFAGATFGVACAAAVHVTIGAPGRRTSAEVVAQALSAAGIPVTGITPVAHRLLGPLRYAVRAGDGRDLDVKVVHRMHRRLGHGYRLRRLLRSLGTEMEPRLSSPWHEADHEALVAILAERAGVRTPPVQLVTGLAHGPAIIVRRRVAEPTSLEHAAATGRYDWIEDLWRQVTLLHTAGIVHHDLRTDSLLVDGQDRLWMVDLTYAEAGASREHQTQDVAETLLCLVPLVGVDEAIASAMRHLDADTLTAALLYLHPLALPPRVREHLDNDRALLAELREAVAEQTGTSLPSPGWPMRPSTLISLGVLGLAVYLLLPQFARLDLVFDELRHANPWYVVGAVAAGLLVFPVSALAVTGASPDPLGFWRTTVVQVAATFAARITPGGVGLIGVNYAYLERLGMSRARAAGVVALNRTAGLIVAGVGIGAGVLVLGGSWTLGRLPVPPLWSLLAGAAVVMALAGVAIRLPSGRRLLRTTAQTLRELAATARRPLCAAQLFGGTAGFLAVNGLGLAASVAAYGTPVSVATVLAVYLVGGTLGNAAPTPGGLGAVEAALVAGLTATGTTASVAIAGVLTYRLASFWLPIAIGPTVTHRLRRKGVI